MELRSQIQGLAEEVFEQTLARRRHIHSHPELSFEEVQTAAFVQQQLDEMGIPYTTDIGGHGVVGLIKGVKTPSEPGNAPVVALRADMDALPIEEENEVPYKSQNPGVMHACGHDVHTSSLLGTASILQQLRSHFSGTIKLLFQPSEERVPGGASLMIKDGALKAPDVQAIFGQHVMPFIPVGKVN